MFLNNPELGTTFAQLAGLPDADAPRAGPDVLKLTNLSRRGFVLASGGLVMGLTLAGCSSGEPSPETDTEGAVGSPLTNVLGGDATPALWIAIEASGAVKITCHRSEMGQQVWTSMAQIVADELEANWDNVEIVQALGDPKYGDQNTDGSRSVRFNFHRLRVAGAAMRAMLEQAAADQWGVDASECAAELGQVAHTPTGRHIGYGDIAEAAGKLAVPTEDEVILKAREDWRYIGKEISSLTVRQVVRGEGTYGIDVQLPDMVHAVIARPPQIFGKRGSVDDSAALAVPGVLQTFYLPEPNPPALFQPVGGVAIIASDTWAAIQGRAALNINWQDGPNANHNSPVYEAELIASAQKPGEIGRKRGDVAGALETAANRITADYFVPYYSHSPMEPPSATAVWTGDTLECWACVQDPQSTRGTLAGALGMPPEKITVHATWLGGAFGRKSKPDFVVEAALIAREMGRPVKVTWTREDDLRYDYYHSVSAQHLEAGLDADGKCTSWLHRTAFPSISSTFEVGVNRPSAGELGLGASDTPFDVPNLQLEAGEADAHVRIGWLRSVANNHHAFAVQSFAAEVAHAAGRDQKDYLLELIGRDRHIDPNTEGAEYGNYSASLEEYPIDTQRLKQACETAAEMAGWGRSLPDGHGLGISVHRSFLTYVATAVEVAVDAEGTLSIPGIWLAVDAGTVVNPRHVRAQMEGGTIYGLSNALYGEITVADGAVVQENFPDWRLMRMSEAPRAFEVEIIASTAPPGGVGEPGTPGGAPALTNAIFDATGMRIRRLPILGADNQRLSLDTRQDT